MGLCPFGSIISSRTESPNSHSELTVMWYTTPQNIASSVDKYVNAIGEERISGFFDVILPKVFLSVVMIKLPLPISWSQNMAMNETKEFRHAFTCRAFDREQLNFLRVPIICYRGRQTNEEHSLAIMDKEPSEYNFCSSWFWHRAIHHFIEMYTTPCTVQGNISNAIYPPALTPTYGSIIGLIMKWFSRLASRRWPVLPGRRM